MIDFALYSLSPGGRWQTWPWPCRGLLDVITKSLVVWTFAWQAVLLLYRRGEQRPHGMTGGGVHAVKCLDGASWGCGESPRASEGQSLEKQSIGYQIHRRTETGGNMGWFISHFSVVFLCPFLIVYLIAVQLLSRVVCALCFAFFPLPGWVMNFSGLPQALLL